MEVEFEDYLSTIYSMLNNQLVLLLAMVVRACIIRLSTNYSKNVGAVILAQILSTLKDCAFFVVFDVFNDPVPFKKC